MSNVIPTGPGDDEEPMTIEYKRGDVELAVNVWVGYDGVTVVQIDTSEDPGRLRVNINEGIIWDGDPKTDDHPGAHYLDHAR